MVYWNRFISYIYRYHDGSKCENVGFAKVAKTGRTGRLTIGLRDGMNRQEEIYEVYIYRETLPDETVHEAYEKQKVIPVPVLMGRMNVKSGHGEETFSFDWGDAAQSKRPIMAFSGIVIRRAKADAKADSSYYESDMFCSSWTDNLVDYRGMWNRISTPPSEDAEQRAAAAFTYQQQAAAPAVSAEDTICLPAAREESEPAEDTAEEAACVPAENVPESGTEAAMETMFKSYERLPLLPVDYSGDEQGGVIESVKITPNDIGLLDMANWRLGVNSFLTHGFYSYKYLMLGKVAFAGYEDRPCYVLGVPGVYSSREKYLAGIFGFERFVPEKETQIKTGSFGYWLIDIR